MPITTQNIVKVSEQREQKPVERPTRYNAWEMRQQTYCCGKWWNGDTCLYGCHKLK